MSDVLKPSPSLLSKLGSIVVHVDEFVSPGGHAFDLAALKNLMADDEITTWLREARKMALIPEKRS